MLMLIITPTRFTIVYQHLITPYCGACAMTSCNNAEAKLFATIIAHLRNEFGRRIIPWKHSTKLWNKREVLSNSRQYAFSHKAVILKFFLYLGLISPFTNSFEFQVSPEKQTFLPVNVNQEGRMARPYKFKIIFYIIIILYFAVNRMIPKPGIGFDY